MGIFTMDSLHGVAWILAGSWSIVKLIGLWIEHQQVVGWRKNETVINDKHRIARELEEVKKERDMMMAHFFPEKEEVLTETATPAKKKRGRPRKYK